MQDEVTVTQADREAALPILCHLYVKKGEEPALFIAEVKAGKYDDHYQIKAFACHRHQAERETLARMEWRDIESAPKNGTRFLAWCPYVGRVIMRIDGVHRETWTIDPSGRLGCNPTKWIPLPPAPEAGQ